MQRIALIFISLIAIFSPSSLMANGYVRWQITQWSAKSIEDLPIQGRTRVFRNGYECSVEPFSENKPRLMTCNHEKTSFQVGLYCDQKKVSDSVELKLGGESDSNIITFACDWCAPSCTYPETLDKPTKIPFK